MTGEDEDVAAVLDDLRRRVRERRAQAGGAGPGACEDEILSDLQAAIQETNAHARVNSHLPLLWEDMVIGRLSVLVRRVVRRLLRWYINPIVDQQNMYNAAATRALNLLATENARLRRQHGELEARLSALQERGQADG